MVPAFADLHNSPNSRSSPMRRRGSSIHPIRNSPSPTPSSFSTYDPFWCSICGITLCTTTPAVFDEHVDYCKSRRTMISPFAQQRSISPASSSDACPSETSGNLNAVFAPYTPRHEYEDARYTISGTGDAIEFGGFGAVGAVDADRTGVDCEYYVPRTVSLRRKQQLGRAGLRRRLAADIDPFSARGVTP